MEMAVHLLVHLTLQKKTCKKQLTKRPQAVIITYVVRNDSPENPKYGGLAQLGERLHGMQEVSGSIPLFSTNEEQNEHEVTIQMVGNVFVLFCEIPSV